VAKGREFIRKGVQLYDRLGANAGDPHLRNRALGFIADSFGWFSAERGTAVNYNNAERENQLPFDIQH
jgi:hypothetical protein